MPSLSKAVDAATSSDLTEDDYSLLLDVVDAVKSDPNKNVSAAVDLVKQKLQSSNANTVLRTITLVDFLAENCGAMMKAELAKKSFVDDYLVKIVNDHRMHTTVKYAVIKEIYKLSKSFKDDSSLKAMGDAFNQLQSSNRYLCQQAVSEVDSGREPNLDGNQEDEDLKRAIEMSLKESTSRQSSRPGSQRSSFIAPASHNPHLTAGYQAYPAPPQQTGYQGVSHSGSINSIPTAANAAPTPQQPARLTPTAPPTQPTKAAPPKVRALYDLSTDDPDTLQFTTGDIITVVDPINKDWFRGCLRGKMGIVPANYVEKVPETREEDLSRLKDSLSRSFDVEMLLSKLMDLNTRVKNNSVSGAEFENALVQDGIPSKMEEIQTVRSQLKQVLDLYKLKIAELESVDQDIDSSVDLYQRLLTQQASPEDSAAYFPDISELSIDPTGNMSYNGQGTQQGPPQPGQLPPQPYPQQPSQYPSQPSTQSYGQPYGTYNGNATTAVPPTTNVDANGSYGAKYGSPPPTQFS